MNKHRVYSASKWVGTLLILTMPFFLETLIWTHLDIGTQPEILDLGLGSLLSVGSLILFWVLLRSLKKAAIWAFGAIFFFIIFMESRNLPIFDVFPPGKIMSAVKMGICSGIAFGIAFLAFHLAKFLMRKNLRFWIVACLSLIIIVFNFMPAFPDSAEICGSKSPSVIFIIMDTARADHLSVYGYHRQTTPFLEKFAEKAAVYERAISPAPWTPSAHASLLTGLLPAEHGTDGDFLIFDPPSPSLVELLKSLGYQTAAIVNNPQLDPVFGWNKGFDYHGMTWKAPKTSIARIRWQLKPRPEDWIWTGDARRTVSIAQRWWVSKSRQPKFLFLNFIDPHSPYGDPHPYKNFFLNETTEKAPDISNDSEDYDAGLVRAEGRALDRVIAFYDADIRFLDFCLGVFFQWLQQRSELDHCVIIITSDHGERLGERGLLGHQLGLDHVLLHVPLIIRYPPLIQAGRYPKQVQSHHIFFLLLNLIKKTVSGDRFKEAAHLELPESQIIVAQMQYQGGYLESLKRRNPQFDNHPYAGNWNSASDGRLKLWQSTSGVIRLYDLLEDPAEQNDISEKLPWEVERLLATVSALPEFRSGKRARNVPPHLLELLKSLGYVHK